MIQLSNGAMWDHHAPDPSLLTIEVIASSLSKQCRFSGHTKRFYSVAEHCVRGSWICKKNPRGFLLHDAAEALVVDVPTPLKELLEDYRPLEERHHQVVAERFGVTFDKHVKLIDMVMLVTEAAELMPRPIHLQGINPYVGWELASQSGRPETWEKMFIQRYEELTSE